MRVDVCSRVCAGAGEAVVAGFDELGFHFGGEVRVVGNDVVFFRRIIFKIVEFVFTGCSTSLHTASRSASAFHSSRASSTLRIETGPRIGVEKWL